MKENSTYAIVTLAFMAFGLVAAEFVPVSLLTLMSADFGITDASAGHFVTITAISAAIAGPVCVITVGRFDRRSALLGICCLLFAASMLAGTTTSLLLMLLSRALSGLALGSFWALSAGTVVELVPDSRIAMSLALVAAGVSLATVIAPPLSAILAEGFGWRFPVFLTAAIAGLSALAVLATMPPLPKSKKPRPAVFLMLLKRTTVFWALMIVFVLVMGHFAAFTFLRPVIEHGSENIDAVAMIFTLFGIAGLIGNFAGGWMSTRNSKAAITSSALGLSVAAVAMLSTGADGPGGALAIFLWGISFGAAPVSMQSYLLSQAPRHPEHLGALNLVVFQAGIAAGAVTGALSVYFLGVSALFVPLVVLPLGSTYLLYRSDRAAKLR